MRHCSGLTWIVRLAVAAAIASVSIAGVTAQRPQAQLSLASLCVNSTNVPLPDLERNYRGLEYGLYPGKRNTPPDEYLALGVDAASRIRPLDTTGKPSAGGRIVLMSLGMSNTRSEFASFITRAGGNLAINKRVMILNGSMSGADAAMWANPDSQPWQFALRTASAGNLSPNQVQAIWVKQADLQTAPFPQEVDALKTYLQQMIGHARTLFPNIRIVYLSSRTRAGHESRQGPGEPQAYETAFAVRRVIQERMEGKDSLGPMAPWMAWGPYLWSNGTMRSDGFVWSCGDLVQRDLLHPSDSGSEKVADQLMAFFMTSETATPWFLDDTLSKGGPRIAEILPSAVGGRTPLTVDFTANVTGATRVYWSFEDGTYSVALKPRKTFYVSGNYDVQLTVVDDTGRWAKSSVAIHAGT